VKKWREHGEVEDAEEGISYKTGKVRELKRAGGYVNNIGVRSLAQEKVTWREGEGNE
jgi:hypothetical protein